jgi:putative phosphoribosyl transferase
MRLFKNRHHAGRILARKLSDYAGGDDVIVLGLPRGGVPVAYEVATELQVPLDVFVVRKIGAPYQPEFAIGAIASGGICVLDRDAIAQLGVAESQIASIIRSEALELERRDKLYRTSRPFPDLTGLVVVIVDDGLATGASMRVAVEAVRARHPARVIAAAPVASGLACEALREVADDCVCAASPELFYGVGRWYDDFSQTTDHEVITLLDSAFRQKTLATTSHAG